MKRYAGIGLLLAMLAALAIFATLSGCGKSAPAPGSPEAVLRESYRALKSAFANNLGQEASRHVTAATIDMYDRCRKLAIDSTGTDLESLPQIEVLLVLQLRWLVPKAELEKMDGAGVFAWGVETGLANKRALATMELDKVRVTGDKATATLLNDGKPMPGLNYFFELQDGVWRFDYVQVLAQTESAFAGMREQSGKNKVDTAAELLKTMFKKDVPPEIFTGPLK